MANKYKRLIEESRRHWAILLLISMYVIIFLFGQAISDFLFQEEFQRNMGEAVYQGWLCLVDYMSAHILLCLIPAFFIAGGMNVLLGEGAVLRYLSGKVRKWLSYIIAAVGGFFIEVCSCTILPLFAGIWKKGAGLGIAITFLYAGPAINMVAFILTGARIGWGFAFARLIFSIVFSIAVGLIMAFTFRKEKQEHEGIGFVEDKLALKGGKAKVFWTSLIIILFVGTAPIENALKYPLIAVFVVFQLAITIKWLRKDQKSAWWNETVKFFTDIIPLLLVGVFVASFITHLIPEEQFRQLTGENNLLTNFAAVMFGAIAYFPALVEVPIAENFMKLGMNQGPLMAYMLSDPVLSLQGLLIISKILGKKKTAVYAISVVVLTTFAGLFYGMIA